MPNPLLLRGNRASGLSNTEIDRNFQLANAGYYSIAAYGALPTNTPTQNSVAIAAAVAAAENDPRGGVVYIPSGGDYLHNGNIPYTGRVAFRGAGRDKSCLKSATAAPCFVNPSMDSFDFAATISGLRLEGNNIGTIAIKSIRQAHFKWEDLFIGNFTQKGIELYGSLIGEFNYVTVENCNIGCDAYKYGGEQNNLVRFNYCTWRLNKTRAVQFSDCAAIHFDFNEISGNGTDGDLETGCFKMLNASPLREGVGMTWTNCWWEQNWGNYIDLREPLNDTAYIMSGCIFQLGNPVHGQGHGLRVIGRNKKSTVLLNACSLKEESTTYDVYATGPMARVVKCPITVVGTFMTDEAAAYETVFTVSSALGGGATPPPVVAAGSSYRFLGQAQELSAVNPSVLGFRPGLPCTIAMRLKIDTNGGRFSISRGTDSVRNWDINFALNGDGFVRLDVSLFDDNGNYLNTFAGQAGNMPTPSSLLQPGTYYVAVIRYDGGVTASSLDMLVENSTSFSATAPTRTGAFSGVSTGNNLRIGRVLNQAPQNSYLDVLEFIDKRLSDAEASEFYSTPEATKSYDANVLARYKFINSLADDKNAHALSAASPMYV